MHEALHAAASTHAQLAGIVIGMHAFVVQPAAQTSMMVLAGSGCCPGLKTADHADSVLTTLLVLLAAVALPQNLASFGPVTWSWRPACRWALVDGMLSA